MDTKSLTELKQNQTGVIDYVFGNIHLKRRLLELGFTKGSRVRIINVSPLKNSYLLELHGYVIALRQNAVKNIQVVVE